MIPQIELATSGIVEDEAAGLTDRIDQAIAACVKVANLRFPEHAELSILLACDATLKSLNRKWRDRDKPTNVLSFPSETLKPGDAAGMMLGDIAISLETAKREAKLENKSMNDHFTHLLVHGFLHLFGYDHMTAEEAGQMEGLETKILKELGIADPYHDG